MKLTSVDVYFVRPRWGYGVDVNKELVVEENKPPHSWKNPSGVTRTARLRNGKIRDPHRCQAGDVGL